MKIFYMKILSVEVLEAEFYCLSNANCSVCLTWVP